MNHICSCFVIFGSRMECSLFSPTLLCIPWTFFSLSTYQVKNSYLNQIGKHFLFITLTLTNNKLFYPIHGTEGKYSIQNKYTMYKVKIAFFFLQLPLILFTRELNCSPESTFWILTPYVASSYIFVRYEHLQTLNNCFKQIFSRQITDTFFVK